MLNWTSAHTDNPGDQVADTTLGGYFEVGPDHPTGWAATLLLPGRSGTTETEMPLGSFATEQAAKDAAQAYQDEHAPTGEDESAPAVDMTAPSGNTNCLEGIRCPRCGAEDKFEIDAQTTVTVFDDGTDGHSDVAWDETSGITCCDCAHTGRVADFRVRAADAVEARPQGAPVVADEVVTVQISTAHLALLHGLYVDLTVGDRGAGSDAAAVAALGALVNQAR